MQKVTRTLLSAVLMMLTATMSSGLMAEDKPETVAIKPDKFRVTVKLSGVFESSQLSEVKLRPDVWSTFKVESVAPQGTRVKQGDVILKFESKEIDEAIREATFEVENGKLSHEEARVELEALKKLVPLDLNDARESFKMANVELDYYQRFYEKLNRMRTDMSLKSSEQNLESVQEEYDQLNKMYKADDLTEETEEIVLKRAMQQIESAKLWHEFSKVSHQEEIQFGLPKAKQRVEEGVVRASLNLQRVEVTLPASLRKKEIEVEKTRLSLSKNEEKLAQLKEDRKLMTIISPADGIVYYGACERGRWGDAQKLAESLKPGESAATQTVLLTIVNHAAMFVRAEVPEKELYRVLPESPGRMTPTAYPHDRINCRVATIEPVAFGDVIYDARIMITSDPPHDVHPGMNCEVVLTTYEQGAVLSLPNDAVFTDDDDDSQKYVYVDEGGKGIRRDVKTGESSETRTEITAGLVADEVVHLKKP